MKFIYEYRTSNNVLRKDIVTASSRDAAFALLKSQGVRPARLQEAPGFFNKLFGKGKRWMLIVILLGVASFLLFFVFVTQGELEEVREELAEVSLEVKTGFSFDNKTRRQIVGDTAIIELGVKTQWRDVFEGEGERFLSAYAMPGVFVKRQNPDYQEIRKSLNRVDSVNSSDSIEVRQIKAIVAGMKDEIREYCEEGGRIEGYCERLQSRQDEEYNYFRRAVNEIDLARRRGMSESELIDLWKSRNDELRNMGIKMVPLP